MSPTVVCGSGWGWGMQFDNGGRRRGKVQEQQWAPPWPPLPPSLPPYQSLYTTVFPFSQPSSIQPCLHFNHLAGHFLNLRRGLPVLLISGRAGEWSCLTSWGSPGVRGLFWAGKTRSPASASSIPIAELDNAALFIRETEWLYSLYSSPLAVNQGN